jgi:hypothetical protein
MISIVIAALALLVSITTAWLTLFRRGTVTFDTDYAFRKIGESLIQERGDNMSAGVVLNIARGLTANRRADEVSLHECERVGI